MRLAPPFLVFYGCHPHPEVDQVEFDILSNELGVVFNTLGSMRDRFRAALPDDFAEHRMDAFIKNYGVITAEIEVDDVFVDVYFPTYPAVVDTIFHRNLFGTIFEDCPCYLSPPWSSA